MSDAKPVAAVIVGLGRWGQNLVTAVSDQTICPLRFVQGVTRTPAKATDFAASQGFPISDDFDAMLNDASVEAVVLATPHSQHFSHICKAARLVAGCCLQQARQEIGAHMAHFAGLMMQLGFSGAAGVAYSRGWFSRLSFWQRQSSGNYNEAVSNEVVSSDVVSKDAAVELSKDDNINTEGIELSTNYHSP